MLETSVVYSLIVFVASMILIAVYRLLDLCIGIKKKEEVAESSPEEEKMIRILKRLGEIQTELKQLEGWVDRH